MREFWHIVPIGDGYTYLCRDKEDNHFLNRKGDKAPAGTVLSFQSEREAKSYIIECLDDKKYKPEQYWIINLQENAGCK